MKKLFLVLILVVNQMITYAQEYWQQELHYTIDVSLSESAHSLNGFLAVDYINHSPDTLHFIWFHLWPNGYKNENTAFSKQLSAIKDRTEKRKLMKENGYIDSLQFMAYDRKLEVETDPSTIDLIKVILPSPLLPNQKISITTPFHVKVPSYASRLGFEGDMYMISQWYPKPAVYDRKGWHPIPYLDQGEFYSDYGSYKVNITVPSNYIIGATGILQNEDERAKYKAIGRKNYELVKSGKNRVKWETYTNTVQSPTKTLSYYGEQIHDFAWFADKDFIINTDTLKLPSGKVIDVFSYYQPDGNAAWRGSVDFIKDAVTRYSNWIGEYPYPVVNAVEGPANGSSGGMEYPMITLITSPDANKERLDAVITHEVGHNWFYGILGTNERDHAWMDEGINSYYQFRYEAEKYKANSIFGNAIPQTVKEKSTEEFLGIIYNAFNQMDMKQPVETASTAFTSSEAYGLTVYVKAAMWMYILELTIGKEKMERSMQSYFREWKFKHPYPEDMKAAIEKESGVSMDNVFQLLDKEGGFK